MIYYVYKKSNGEFSGSGVKNISNKDYESTTVAPDRLPEGETLAQFWEGGEWVHGSQESRTDTPPSGGS